MDEADEALQLMRDGADRDELTVMELMSSRRLKPEQMTDGAIEYGADEWAEVVY